MEVIMETVLANGEMLVFPGRIIMDYKHAAGKAASKFLTELRDNKRLLAIKCPVCQKVYMPPRLTCKTCFANMSEWIELEGSGTVLTYTIVNYAEPVHPVEAPVIYGIIQLDGADTGFVHFLNEVEPEELRVGLRVKPVFKEKREGNILDIRYFKPISKGLVRGN
jgi:uncharacterized OB-fold protein